MSYPGTGTHNRPFPAIDDCGEGFYKNLPNMSLTGGGYLHHPASSNTPKSQRSKRFHKQHRFALFRANAIPFWRLGIGAIALKVRKCSHLVSVFKSLKKSCDSGRDKGQLIKVNLKAMQRTESRGSCASGSSRMRIIQPNSDLSPRELLFECTGIKLRTISSYKNK